MNLKPRQACLGTLAFAGLVLWVVPLVLYMAGGAESPASFSSSQPDPLVTSPTPRTVTDERQLRITAVAIAGPEVAAGAARGTVTSVTANAGETLADGAVVFQVDGIDRVGFASSIPFYRPIAPNTEGAVKVCASALSLIDIPPKPPIMAGRPNDGGMGDGSSRTQPTTRLVGGVG